MINGSAGRALENSQPLPVSQQKRRGPQLSREQRARVRSMIEDEGQTRAEAVAWVLAFEPATEPHSNDCRVSLLGDISLDGAR